jgi:glutathione synthase/RimK-type ligase-like ATP-grasp enzyme
VVIDDAQSILRCNNKVYTAELLSKHDVATPRTLIVHRDNLHSIVQELGLPCVLKQPDSAFSLGVTKAMSESELMKKIRSMLEKSELIIAQEFLPTEFDWRIGVLDRKLLYAAKYYMAPGHWQIINHAGDDKHYVEGQTLALPLDQVPRPVLKLALQAANLFGNGFYGVDIKQIGDRCCVIEVNDNPNVDAGNEDQVIGDALYRAVMQVFLQRIEARKLAGVAA